MEDRTRPRPAAASNWLLSAVRVAFYFRTAGSFKSDQWLFCTGFCNHLAQLEEHLLLMRRLLSESVPPARRRGWLTEQCRRRGDDERELWRALARYRQIGAAGLLTADRPARRASGARASWHARRC